MAEQKDDNCADIYRIKAVPKTKPTVNDNFELIKGEKLNELKENELLIESEFISVDPYQRGRIGQWFKTESKQMQSFTVAKVLKSKNDKYKKDEFIYGVFPWSSKQIIQSKQIMSIIPPDLSQYKPKEDKDYNKELDDDDDNDNKFNIDDIKNISHSYYVGSYGMPGQTAYYGMIYRGEIKKGDNVLISGAAGAVGSICGQISKKIYKCYTVGIAGKEEKLKWITKDLGFDAGINYKNFNIDNDKIKNEKEQYKLVQDELKKQFPKGIDLYFDNVGGIFTEAVWDILNPGARVVVCGQISTYNDDKDNPKLIRPFLGKTIYKEIDIRGVYVGNFKNKTKFYYDMGKWISNGKIKVKETVINGFEKTPQAFVGLFTGINIGKMVVKC